MFGFQASKRLHHIFLFISLALLVLLGSAAGSSLGGFPESAVASRIQAVPWAAGPTYESFFPGQERATSGACAGLFAGKIGDQEFCTQGFDPVFTEEARAQGAMAKPAGSQSAQIICDGDGESGKRIQMMYVHPPETDRYAQYLASFQQWAKDMDDIFSASAAETGGSRHVRFVHDSNCLATVLNVQVSSAAINAPWNPYPMWDEVAAQGYNRTDRIYVIFTETSSYTLGVSVFMDDDRPGIENVNNSGPSYTSSPVAVWGGSNLAHELMHSLGAVNSSAPHTLSGGHCSDEYDRMCYGAGVTIVCSDPAHEQRFDCNHDDYFHTNPAPGSYLATHWNAANNQFLIGAPAAVKTWTGAVDSEWSTAGNWSPSGEPTAGYDCLIPAGATNYPVLDNGEGGQCFGKLTVELNAGITVGPEGSLLPNTMVISGTVDVLGVDSYINSEKDIRVAPGGQLSFASGSFGLILEKGGTVTVDGMLFAAQPIQVLGGSPLSLVVGKNGAVILSSTGGLKIDGTVTNNGVLRQTRQVPAGATTSFLNITNVAGTETLYYGVEITPPGGGGMGETTVTINGNQVCPETFRTLGFAVRRCYTIDPEQAQSATVKFYYRSAEANNNPLPEAFHFNGTTWDGLASTRGGSGEGMFVTATNVSQYDGSAGYATPFALKDPAVITYYMSLPFVRR